MSILSNTQIGKFAKNLDVTYLTDNGFDTMHGERMYYKGNKNQYVYKIGDNDFLYYIGLPVFDIKTWTEKQQNIHKYKYYNVHIRTKHGIDMLIKMFNAINQKNRIKLKKRFVKELKQISEKHYEI